MARARSPAPAALKRRKSPRGHASTAAALALNAAEGFEDIVKEQEKSLDVLTGSHGIAKAEELEMFIWRDDLEPHAARKRALLKKYPEIKKLIGHQWRSKYITFAMIVLQLSMAYYFGQQPLSLPFFVAAYVFGGTLGQALFLSNHETSHNLAFKKFSHNKIWGIFTNLPLVLPYFISFKIYHNEHHKYQGIDGIDTDLPTEFEAWLLRGTVGKLFWLFNQTWFYALRPLFISEQPFTRWHAANVAIQLSFNFGIVYFCGWGPLLYLFFCMQFAGGIHPMAAHFLAEHMVFAGEVETVSYYGPLNVLAWNVGYHNEHHDFPTVAWYNLPKLREIAIEEYGKMPYHKSWVAVLWRFMTDPNVTLYNRVKRKDKTNQSEKLQTAGGQGNIGLLVLLGILIGIFVYDANGGTWGGLKA